MQPLHAAVASQWVLCQVEVADVGPVSHVPVDYFQVHVLQDEAEFDLFVKGDDCQGVRLDLLHPLASAQDDPLQSPVVLKGVRPDPDQVRRVGNIEAGQQDETRQGIGRDRLDEVVA